MFYTDFLELRLANIWIKHSKGLKKKFFFTNYDSEDKNVAYISKRNFEKNSDVIGFGKKLILYTHWKMIAFEIETEQKLRMTSAIWNIGFEISFHLELNFKEKLHKSFDWIDSSEMNVKALKRNFSLGFFINLRSIFLLKGFL